VKIFILKPSSLGDVVQALPVLRLLKRHWPAAEVYWWLDRALVPLLADDPDLAGIIPFDRQRWVNPWHWTELAASIRRARRLQFEVVIDLQGLARSGLFAWLANGDILLGVDDPREGARGFYDLIVPRASFHTHAVEWYLGALPLLGVPVHRDFTWLPPRPAVREELARKWPLDKRPVVLLQPGARWANKRWPTEHFVELARRLQVERPSLLLAILGAKEDQPLGQVLTQALPGRCLDLTGRTTLPEMVEWIRLARVLVTNDTGPMHVAAALGRPVVAVFGPTEPRRTGPFTPHSRVLQTSIPCVPCLRPKCAHVRPMECLTSLAPERLLPHVLAFLDQPRLGAISP
jgi:lipopolysaccharide heptosyltransferase I